MFEEGTKNVNEFFLGQFDDLFLLGEFNNFLSDPHKENMLDIPQKQPVKFILTKEEVPIQIPSYLQKKTIKSSNTTKEENKSNDGRWTKDEQYRFAEAVFLFGNDWKKIQEHVSSRNITQVRSHAQKFLMKLKENQSIIEKGLQTNLSWTKTMNFLQRILNNNELKDVLFSVEQSGHKKNVHKVLKGLKKIVKEEKNDEDELKRKDNCNEIYDNGDMKVRKMSFAYDRFGTFLNLDKDYGFHKNNKKTNEKPEEEQEFLKKFIKCFNPSQPSDNNTLNSSFDETSFNDESSKYIGFNSLNKQPIKFDNIDNRL